MMRTLGLFLTCLLLTSVLIAQSSPRAPRVRGFIAAFNSGDVDNLLGFLKENGAPAWLAKRTVAEDEQLFSQLLDELGKLEVEGISFDGTATARIVASSSRMDGKIAIGLDFEPQEPYRIAGLSVDQQPDLPDGFPPLPALDGSIKENRTALERYFAGLAEDGRFSGAVRVQQGDRTLFEGAYGLADRAWKVPNDLATRFNLGSINKQFTKVAIAQLAAAGKLSFEDTILDQLPDYPNRETAAVITIRQLLAHRSGLGDIFVPAFFATNRASLRTDRDYFRLFADLPLEFEPGTQQQYSNAGYAVLGAVVAAVSGMSYPAYIERHVFAAAGMDGADFAALDEINEKVAVGYTRQSSSQAGQGALRPNSYMMPIVGFGAGGAVATAADLVAFDRALRNHTLLDPRYTAWIFTGDLPDETPTGPVTGLMGIAGGGPGVSAILESEGDFAIAVLCNLDPPSAESLGLALAGEMRKQR